MLDRPALAQFDHFIESGDLGQILHIVFAPGTAHRQASSVRDYLAASSFRHVVLTVSRDAVTIWDGADVGRSRSAGAYMPIGSRFWGAGSHGLSVKRAMLALLASHRVSPDLVQTYQPSPGGMAATLLADHLQVPLAVSVPAREIHGETRFAALSRTPFYRVLERAELILVRHGWAFRWAAAPMHGAKTVLIPAAAENATNAIQPLKPTRGFLVVADLDGWRRNGLQELLWALAISAKHRSDARLDIVGAGTPHADNTVRSLMVELGISDRVELLGEIPRERLLADLPKYLAVVASSFDHRSETLALEALCAGVPLVFPQEADVHGLLSGIFTGKAADMKRVEAISEALSDVLEKNELYRGLVSRHAGELYRRFSIQSAAMSYTKAVGGLLSWRRNQAG